MGGHCRRRPRRLAGHRIIAIFATAKACRAIEGIDLETKRFLPRLAHHRGHRFRQNHVRHKSTRAPGLPQRAEMGRPLHRRKGRLLGNTESNGGTLRSQSRPHLQIRPDNDFKWVPPHRFNLVGDRSIPFSTYAKFVVDTATSLGQGGDKGFFKSQAQTHIAHALELLAALNRPATLRGAYELLSDRVELEAALDCVSELLPTPNCVAIQEHFNNRFLEQPDEQLGGVRETTGNYLQYFLTPEVADVFC